MFEKEIEFITDFNLNKIKNFGAYLTLQNLSSAQLHPAILQYISANLEHRIYLDQQRLLQKSAFDYSGDKISNLLSMIADEIKINKMFPYDEIENLIKEAVMFNINLILRTHWTLLKFIYNNTNIHSASEIKLFLNYIYYYDYYKKILLSLIEKKNLNNIDIQQFTDWLNKIQNELISSQVQNFIDNGLYTISEFLNIGEVYKDKLNIGTVQIFLKENNLENYILKIRRNLNFDPKQKFSIEEFRKALYSEIQIENVEEQIDLSEESQTIIDNSLKYEEENISTESKEEIETTIEDESNIITENNVELEEENNLIEENIVDDINENDKSENKNLEDFSEENILQEENEQDFESILNEELQKSFEQFDTKEKEKFLNEENSESEKEIKEQNLSSGNLIEENKKEMEAKEKNDSAKVEELFNLFTSRETMRIISSVFNQDSIDFVNTMESISNCENFEQANEILKSVFNSYKVTIFNNKEANLLQLKVQDYFSGEVN